MAPWCEPLSGGAQGHIHEQGNWNPAGCGVQIPGSLGVCPCSHILAPCSLLELSSPSAVLLVTWSFDAAHQQMDGKVLRALDESLLFAQQEGSSLFPLGQTLH